MNIDLVNNLITSGVTLVVGAVGAIYAYKGALNGAKMQIESEQERAKMQFKNDMKQLNETRIQQAKFTRKAIDNFISNEIKSNFMKLNTPHFSAQIATNEKPFQYGVNYTYTYDEFNNLKYELIKFESTEVEVIINIYDMFLLLERKQEIKTFTQSEYEAFKAAFNNCRHLTGKKTRN